MSTPKPKTLGMVYDRRKQIWGGTLPATVVPFPAVEKRDHTGAVWQWWDDAGYRFRRSIHSSQAFATRF